MHLYANLSDSYGSENILSNFPPIPKLTGRFLEI